MVCFTLQDNRLSTIISTTFCPSRAIQIRDLAISMGLAFILGLLAVSSLVIACPDHLSKRSDEVVEGAERSWLYVSANDWGRQDSGKSSRMGHLVAQMHTDPCVQNGSSVTSANNKAQWPSCPPIASPPTLRSPGPTQPSPATTPTGVTVRLSPSMQPRTSLRPSRLKPLQRVQRRSTSRAGTLTLRPNTPSTAFDLKPSSISCTPKPTARLAQSWASASEPAGKRASSSSSCLHTTDTCRRTRSRMWRSI